MKPSKTKHFVCTDESFIFINSFVHSFIPLISFECFICFTFIHWKLVIFVAVAVWRNKKNIVGMNKKKVKWY